VVQLIAGVFALLCRDSAAATLMLSFATTWLVDALVFWLRPPGTAEALGIFWIVFAVFVAIVLTSALPKGALAAVLAVAAPYFLVSGIAEITGSRPVAHAAAVLGYLLAAVALYTAFALLWEDCRGQEIAPVGRPGPARPPRAARRCSCGTSSGRPACGARYDRGWSRLDRPVARCARSRMLASEQ
jgi:uncharacterized protein